MEKRDETPEEISMPKLETVDVDRMAHFELVINMTLLKVMAREQQLGNHLTLFEFRIVMSAVTQQILETAEALPKIPRTRA